MPSLETIYVDLLSELRSQFQSWHWYESCGEVFHCNDETEVELAFPSKTSKNGIPEDHSVR